MNAVFPPALRTGLPKLLKFAPAGVPGAWLPSRATSASVPAPSDQMPVSLVVVTPPPGNWREARNAVFPSALRTGKVLKLKNLAPVGVPGAWLPSRATSASVPAPSDQMPSLFALVTPPPVVWRVAKNAVFPSALRTGSLKVLKFAPAGVPGAWLASRATSASVPAPSDQIPVLFAVVTPPPVVWRAALNAVFPPALRTGRLKPLKFAPAGVPGAWLPSRATRRQRASPSDQTPLSLRLVTPPPVIWRKALNAVFPPALRTGVVPAVLKSLKFAPAGVPGAWLPSRATSASVPAPSDQMPTSLELVTSPPVAWRRAMNAVFPLASRTGLLKVSKFAPAGVSGACVPDSATVRNTTAPDTGDDAGPKSAAAVASAAIDNRAERDATLFNDCHVLPSKPKRDVAHPHRRIVRPAADPASQHVAERNANDNKMGTNGNPQYRKGVSPTPFPIPFSRKIYRAAEMLSSKLLEGFSS